MLTIYLNLYLIKKQLESDLIDTFLKYFNLNMPLLKNCEPKVNAFSSDILYKIWTSVGSDITASNMCFLRHKTYTWVVAQWANKLFLTGSISSRGKQPSQTIWALPKIYSCHFAKLA